MLRLHSTYRHDLKIYASDEGRVQMTAAAFAKVLVLSGGVEGDGGYGTVEQLVLSGCGTQRMDATGFCFCILLWGFTCLRLL